MILKIFLLIFLIIATLRSGTALAAEDASKPAEAPKVADVPKAAEAPKPPDAPKLIRNSNINVDVLDYTWKSGFVWENFNKTECSWTAKVKNNNPEPRHICINYEFLDEDNLPVFQNGKCEVVLGLSEGMISGSILVQSRLVQDVKKSNVVALEAHRLHSFVPAPPPQTPAAQ